MFRPAGLSDDSDSDWQPSVAETGAIAKTVQHAGMMDGAAAGPGEAPKKKLNSKQRRSQIYWQNKQSLYSLERNLPPVADPALNVESKDYFEFVKKRQFELNQEIKNRSEETGEHLKALDQWKPQSWMTKEGKDELPYKLEVAFKASWEFRGVKVYFIDNATSFHNMMQILGRVNLLSIDLEGHMSVTRLGITALMQIATADAAFLIDPFNCFKNIQKYLRPIIEDPSILKVAHGMVNDYNWLQKDFDILGMAMMDLQLLYNEIRMDGKNNLIKLEALADLFIEDYHTVTSYTLCDWRRRPLTTEMAAYAADDVIIALKLWTLMKARTNSAAIERAFKSTATLMRCAYQRKIGPSALEEVKSYEMNADTVKLSTNQKALDTYELLHQWRQRYADQRRDIPAAVASTRSLIKLSSLSLPVTEEGILSVDLPHATFLMQKKTLLQIINDDAEDLFKRMDKCVCHNCLQLGHAAVFCPFPVNKARVKEYMQQHPESKTAQNRRRRLNKQRNKQLRKESD